jgi:hypothetical protein
LPLDSRGDACCALERNAKAVSSLYSSPQPDAAHTSAPRSAGVSRGLVASAKPPTRGRERRLGCQREHRLQEYIRTPAGSLTVFCQSAYYIQYTNEARGQTAQLWIERAVPGAVDFATVAGVGVHNVLLNGSANEHVTIRASLGSAVTTWDVWATTTGGCRMNITQTTGN